MTRAHANKKGRRYFYYLSMAHRERRPAGSLTRVSAPVLERAVAERVTPLLDVKCRDEIQRAFDAIERVTVGATRIQIDLKEDAIDAEAAVAYPNVARREIGWRIDAPLHLKRKRLCRELVASGEATAPPRVDRALVRAVVMARAWTRALADGEFRSINELASREQLCPIYTGQLLPLAFLAPDLVECILDGRQSPRLTLGALIAQPLPYQWAAQRALFSRLA
jgi:hypothetical protein